jgi:hypothetical protein
VLEIMLPVQNVGIQTLSNTSPNFQSMNIPPTTIGNLGAQVPNDQGIEVSADIGGGAGIVGTDFFGAQALIQAEQERQRVQEEQRLAQSRERCIQRCFRQMNPDFCETCCALYRGEYINAC